MIQNRFYKTTVGVPFELAIGTEAALPAVTTLQEFIDTPVLGAYGIFLNDKHKTAVGVGTALSAAQLKQEIFFAYIKEIVGGKGVIVSTTPIAANTIRASYAPYRAPAFQDGTIAKVAGAILVTQEICFRVIETTAGNTPMPVYDFNEIVVTDVATALGKIASRANADKDNDWFTVTVAGEGLKVVSKDANRHFRLAIYVAPSRQQPIDNASFAYVETTGAFAGSGTLAQVQNLEFESDVKRGITTQYPGAGYTASDFGEVIRISDLSTSKNFDVVVVTAVKSESSPTPLELHSQNVTYFIVVPSGQGDEVLATLA